MVDDKVRIGGCFLGDFKANCIKGFVAKRGSSSLTIDKPKIIMTSYRESDIMPKWNTETFIAAFQKTRKIESKSMLGENSCLENMMAS